MSSQTSAIHSCSVFRSSKKHHGPRKGRGQFTVVPGIWERVHKYVYIYMRTSVNNNVDNLSFTGAWDRVAISRTYCYRTN